MIFEFTTETLPTCWREGAFAGNGLLGLMHYAEHFGSGFYWSDPPSPDGQVTGIRFDLGRADIVDRGNERVETLWHTPNRVPVAKWVLPIQGSADQGRIELDTKQAEIRGRFEKEAAAFTWKARIHAKQPIFIVEVDSESEKAPVLPCLHWSEPVAWDWMPGSQGPGTTDAAKKKAKPRPLEWSSVQVKSLNLGTGIDGELQTRTFSDGTIVAVAWVCLRESEKKQIYLISIGSDPWNKADANLDFGVDLGAEEEVLQNLEKGVQTGIKELQRSHLSWWTAFYNRSAVTLPDVEFNRFYHLQHYKLGCAFRENGPLLDEPGPWSIQTEYPCHWWDLNIQESHSIHLVANHPEFSRPLIRLLERNFQETDLGEEEALGLPTITSFRFSFRKSQDSDSPYPFKRPSTAHVIWLCHHIWEYSQHSGDESVIPFLHELLKRCLKSYFIEKRVVFEEDGYFHLSDCQSPEYPGANHHAGWDSNYDLALFRWGVSVLRETTERVTDEDPCLLGIFSAGERLVPYPVDDHGYRISRDIPMRSAHRHFSHLMMLYPLKMLENPQDLEVARTSLLWWMGDEVEPEEKGRSGFTYTFAASMAAWLGMGKEAESYLRFFLEGARSGQGFTRAKLWPNSMFSEWGPVTETSLGFNRAIQDMLIQSHGKEIRLLPGIPAEWRYVAFRDLLAIGGHRVSLRMEEGRLTFLRLNAGKKAKIRLRHPGIHNLSPSGHSHFLEFISEDMALLSVGAGEELHFTFPKK